jgi:ActR/RegA family two-component response regulator
MELLKKILENIWTVTIIGGSLATILATYVINFFRKKRKITSIATQLQQINTTNISLETNSKMEKPIVMESPNSTKVSYFKEQAEILFIDDLNLKDKIRNLNKAGWQKVKQISEAENVDLREIREADVIFVDYRGVGKSSKDQGLAVIKALQDRYGNKKWLVLYSAHKVPITAFEKGANSYLAKNSSTYEVEQKILEGLQQIHR